MYCNDFHEPKKIIIYNSSSALLAQQRITLKKIELFSQ